jgi:hypothetical protein
VGKGDWHEGSAWQQQEGILQAGPGQHIQTNLKVKFHLNLVHFKTDLLTLENLEVKYGCE